MATDDPEKIELARKRIMKELSLYMVPVISDKTDNKLKEPAVLEVAEGVSKTNPDYIESRKCYGLGNIYRQIQMVKRRNSTEKLKPHSNYQRI